MTTEVGRVTSTGATAAAGSVPLLRLEGLKVWFPIRDGIIRQRHVGDVQAVDGVTFEIERGETLGLVGESGCGKSTTGRAIIRLNPPTGGRIFFDGQDVTEFKGSELRRLRKRMQMIFQDPYASLDPRMTAGGIIAEPLDIHDVGKPARPTGARPGAAPDRRSEPGLRVALPARVLGRPAAAHRRGEGAGPAAGPDRRRRTDQRARRLDPGPDHQPARAVAGRVRADLPVHRPRSERRPPHQRPDRGDVPRAAWSRRRARATSTSGRSIPYTVALLSAVPIPDPVVESRRRRIILKGDVPSPVNPPSGCRFHTRCWLREKLGNPERCVTEDPELRLLDTRHEVACHFAEDVDGSTEQVQATGRPNPRATQAAAPSAAPAPAPSIPPSAPPPA